MLISAFRLTFMFGMLFLLSFILTMSAEMICLMLIGGLMFGGLSWLDSLVLEVKEFLFPEVLVIDTEYDTDYWYSRDLEKSE